MNSLVCGAIVVTVVWWFRTALQVAAKNDVNMFEGRLSRCFIVLACRAFVVWAPEKVEGCSRNASTQLISLPSPSYTWFVEVVLQHCIL